MRPPWPPNRVSSQDADFSSVRPSSRSHRRLHWRGNFFVPQASAMKFGMHAASVPLCLRLFLLLLSFYLAVHLSRLLSSKFLPAPQSFSAFRGRGYPPLPEEERCNRTESGPSPFPNAMPRTFPSIRSVGRSPDCRREIFGMPVLLQLTTTIKVTRGRRCPARRPPPSLPLSRSRSLCGRQLTIQCRVRSFGQQSY